MGKALYRKYRSRSLDEVTGQNHVTDVLKNAIARDKVAHAYLFTGPRGVGKTSIARILAHEINSLPYNDESSHLDIIEIDAASNNGVEDIRDLRSKVNLAPTSAKKKVYIIDEVHMLSKPAFNALLKTLEEPPEHIVFILATTDLDKVPDTIVSRTQRYSFKRASITDIVSLLSKIIQAEKIKADEAALMLIAEHSDGSYRDSVSLLDQLAVAADESTITTGLVEQSLGLANEARMRVLLDSIKIQDFDSIVAELKDLLAAGFQSTIIADQLIGLIQHNSSTYSDLLPLMEKLISVRQSRLPDALLLASLAGFIHVKKPSTPRQVAVTPRSLKKEFVALTNKAVEMHPIDDIVAPIKKSTKKAVPAAAAVMDWKSILSDTSSLSIGLRTVLAKCKLSNTTENNVITIYTRGEFYKKKLDTPKYKQELHALLLEKTDHEWDFAFIPTIAPSENDAVASVAAIMGGGEEVSVE